MKLDRPAFMRRRRGLPFAQRGPDVLRQLLLAGVDVFRLNFSHGTHEQHAEVIGTVRSLAKELGLPVAILGDLPTLILVILTLANRMGTPVR